MSKEIEKAVADFLSEISVSFIVYRLADMDHDKEWKHDLWLANFHKVGGNLECFDVKTGTGHREVKKSYSPSSTYNPKTKRREQLAPVAPSAASVLYCLLSDASAKDESFSDWCNNSGYSSDSISALNTYRACEETGNKLHKIFNREQMAKLRELLQDY